jgi:hypothetical protein
VKYCPFCGEPVEAETDKTNRTAQDVQKASRL